MIRYRTYRSGKMNVASPHLIKYVLPVFLISIGVVLGGILNVLHPIIGIVAFIILALLGFVGVMWPEWGAKMIIRQIAHMEAHPERYYQITAPFLIDVIGDHDDKSGVVHTFEHPLTGELIDFIEFDNEQDRVLFRLTI